MASQQICINFCYSKFIFFQKLYKDADDDTRKAMVKSYTESGGTVLSTNWKEISKKRTEIRPPDGMEFKKW